MVITLALRKKKIKAAMLMILLQHQVPLKLNQIILHLELMMMSMVLLVSMLTVRMAFLLQLWKEDRALK